jgi:hypothetical protein
MKKLKLFTLAFIGFVNASLVTGQIAPAYPNLFPENQSTHLHGDNSLVQHASLLFTSGSSPDKDSVLHTFNSNGKIIRTDYRQNVSNAWPLVKIEIYAYNQDGLLMMSMDSSLVNLSGGKFEMAYNSDKKHISTTLYSQIVGAWKPFSRITLGEFFQRNIHL